MHPYNKQEIKSLYTKKDILNTTLLKLHLQLYQQIHPAIIDNVMDKINIYITDTCLLYTSRCV